MPRHTIRLFSVLMVLCAAAPSLAQQRLPYEMLMREVQARRDPRHVSVGCGIFQWPECDFEGTESPVYPPDGYYPANLTASQNIQLVTDIRNALAGAADDYIAVPEGGLQGLPYLGVNPETECSGITYVQPYSLSLLGVPSGTINADNYEEIFLAMSSAVGRLRNMSLCAAASDCGLMSTAAAERWGGGFNAAPTPAPSCAETCELALAEAAIHYPTYWHTFFVDDYACTGSYHFSDMTFALYESTELYEDCPDDEFRVEVLHDFSYIPASFALLTDVPGRLRVFEGVAIAGETVCNSGTATVCPGIGDCFEEYPACNCDGAGDHAPDLLGIWNELGSGGSWSGTFPSSLQTPSVFMSNITTLNRGVCPTGHCCDEGTPREVWRFSGHAYVYIEITHFDTSPSAATPCGTPDGLPPNTPTGAEAGEGGASDPCAPCPEEPSERQAGSEGGAPAGQGEESVAGPCDVGNGSGAAPGPRPAGSDPIDYESGAKIESITDLAVSYTGMDFRLTRRYTSKPDYAGAGLVGENWELSSFAFIDGSQSGELRLYGIDPRQYLRFVWNAPSSTWVSEGATDQYIVAASVTLEPGASARAVWRLVEPGVRTTDFFSDGAEEGLLADERDLFGNGVRYEYDVHASSELRLSRVRLGTLEELESGTSPASVYFNWRLDGRLGSAWSTRLTGSGGEVPCTRVEYRYHDGTDGDSLGSEGDLIQVTRRVLVDLAEAGLPYRTLVTQYRYHNESVTAEPEDEPLSELDGFNHQLKMVIAPEQIEFFAEYANSTVLTSDPKDRVLEAAEELLGLDDDDAVDFQSLPDLELYQLASKLVGYVMSGTDEGRVESQYLLSACGCGGGASQGIKQLYYYFSGTGYWSTHIQELLENGSGSWSVLHRTQYIDMTPRPSGGTIPYLRSVVIEETGTSPRRWATWYEYDSNGNTTRVGTTSSVTGYTAANSTTVPDITVSSTAGLVRAFVYNGSNYLLESWIRAGNAADPPGTGTGFTLLRRVTYPTTGDTQYLPSEIECFTDGTATTDDFVQATEFEYGFVGSTTTLAWVRTISEAELPAENGPGSTPQTYDEYVVYEESTGRRQWHRAADLTLTYFGYDSTGNITLIVRNADKAGGSGYPALPSTLPGSVSTASWGPAPGDGQVATSFTRDLLGRVTSQTDEGGVTHYTRREMLESPARDNVLYYAVASLPHLLEGATADPDAPYDGPLTISWMNAGGRTVFSSAFGIGGSTSSYDPLAAMPTRIKATGNEWGSLSASQTDYHHSGLVESRTVWHDVDTPTAVYTTSYDYDKLGRVSAMTDPQGTITETDYDVLNRAVEVRVGVGASMSTVAEYFYDDTAFTGTGSPAQGLGDGNLTVVRQHTGDSGTLEAAHRDTITRFDWRNRPVIVQNELAPHSAVEYDNLDRVVERGVFGSVPSTGDPINSSNRLSHTITSYGQRGRVFRSRVAIDPQNATEGYLETHVWFDAVGRTVAEWAPSGPGMKREFDALGRVTDEYTTDRGGDTAPGSGSYADATSLTSDIVLEQAAYRYNDDNRLDLVTSAVRIHDDSTTGGALTTSTGVLTYVGYYYDDAQRRIRTVNFGTNADTGTDPDVFQNVSAPSWPPTTAPTHGASEFEDQIVTAVSHGIRGLPETSTDSEGRITKTWFDDLNRRIAVAENYVESGGTPAPAWNATLGRWEVAGLSSENENRFTTFVYDGNGNVTKQVAHLTQDGSTQRVQVTQYVYGTTAGTATNVDDSLIASNGLLLKVHYPDETTGLPNTTDAFTVFYAYNRLGEVRAGTDQNGTLHAYARDNIGRVTSDEVTFAGGTTIDQTVKEIEVDYDTAGRPSSIRSLGTSSTLNEVEMEYDQLWRLTALWQDPDGPVTTSSGSPTGTTQVVRYEYTDEPVGDGNYARPTRMVYPDGTECDYVYGTTSSTDDRISRVTAMTADEFGLTDELVEYDYVGLGMVAVVEYPVVDILLDRTYQANGQRRSQGITNQVAAGVYAGWDRFGRVRQQAWIDGAMGHSGGLPTVPPILQQTHAYDRASNRTSRYDARPGAKLADRDNQFLYDGLDRLEQERVGVDDTAGGLTAAAGSRQWSLDLLGNWETFAYSGNADFDYTDSGVDSTEPRDHNLANEATTRDMPGLIGTGGPQVDFAYDAAGNMRQADDSANDGTRYTHDAWNRLVRVESVTGGTTIATIAEYAYNGLHHRVYRDNGVDERDLFYYSSDWQLLEERRYEYTTLPGTLARIAQQFWGLRYIDDAIARRVDADANGTYDSTDGGVEVSSPGEGTWFYVTDVQFSVVAVIDEFGALAERVEYDAYGRARHHRASDFDGDGAGQGSDQGVLLGATWDADIGDADYNADCDLNRDGTIDVDDYTLFLLGTGSALDYGLISDPLGPDSPIGYDGYVFAPEAGLDLPAASPLPAGVPPPAIGGYVVRLRWYLPELGRWLQRDPAGYIAGMNSSEAVNSSPVLLTDPTGLAPVLWTFSGINSQVDYVGRLLRCVGVNNQYGWHSRLGTTARYTGTGRRIGPHGDWGTEGRLDEEAEIFAWLNTPIGSACNGDGTKTSIHLIMVAPKTNTRPAIQCRQCCSLTIDVFWSPFDNVPNQRPRATSDLESEAYWSEWAQGGGRVHTMDTRVYNGTEDPSYWTQFLWGAKCPNHNLFPFFTDLPELTYRVVAWDRRGRVRVPVRGWAGTGNSSNALNTIRGAMASSVDRVMVCHSQGCNMAMHLINRMCRIK